MSINNRDFSFGVIPDKEEDRLFCQVKNSNPNNVFAVASIDVESEKVLIGDYIHGKRKRNASSIRFLSKERMVLLNAMKAEFAERMGEDFIQAGDRIRSEKLIISHRDIYLDLAKITEGSDVFYAIKIREKKSGYVILHNPVYCLRNKSLVDVDGIFNQLAKASGLKELFSEVYQCVFDFSLSDIHRVFNPLEHQFPIDIKIIDLTDFGMLYLKVSENKRLGKKVGFMPMYLLSRISQLPTPEGAGL